MVRTDNNTFKNHSLQKLPIKTGFSLIELVLVLFLLGLLASLTYPSYTNYILKTHRTYAKAALIRTQALLENCYAQHFSYSAVCKTLPSFPQTSAQGFYTLHLTHVNETTYTLTATAKGGQTKDTSCTSFSITQANEKTASPDTHKACWK